MLSGRSPIHYTHHIPFIQKRLIITPTEWHIFCYLYFFCLSRGDRPPPPSDAPHLPWCWRSAFKRLVSATGRLQKNQCPDSFCSHLHNAWQAQRRQYNNIKLGQRQLVMGLHAFDETGIEFGRQSGRCFDGHRRSVLSIYPYSWVPIGVPKSIPTP